MSELKRRYEALLFLKPMASEDEVKKVESGFAEAVRAAGGSVSETTHLGKRALSYKIKDFGEALMLQIALEVDSTSVVRLKKTVDFMDSVLRYSVGRASGGGAAALLKPDSEAGKAEGSQTGSSARVETT